MTVDWQNLCSLAIVMLAAAYVAWRLLRPCGGGARRFAVAAGIAPRAGQEVGGRVGLARRFPCIWSPTPHILTSYREQRER